MSTLYCTGYFTAAVLTLGIYTTAVLLLPSLERSVPVGALLSSHYCCRLSIDVLAGAEARDVLGLTALVARGGVFQISCEGDQLDPFGLKLCVGCGGGYAWTSLPTRWCMQVPYASDRSAYPCTESSGGVLTCRTRTGVCRGWPRLRDVYRAVSSSLPGSLAMGVPYTARVTLQLLCSRWVSILQPYYCYPAWSGRC